MSGPGSPPPARPGPSWHRVVERGYSSDCLWYAQFVNQYLALPPTYLFWRLGLRPNQVSAISFVITLAAVAGMFFFPPAGLAGSIGVYLLLSFGYVLDSSDGQLARAAGLGSRMGFFLDHFLDGVKILLVNAALGWILVRASVAGAGIPLASAFGAFVFALVGQGVFFIAYNFKGLIYEPKLVATHLPSVRGNRRHLLPLQPTDYGLFVLLALLCHVPERLLAAYWVFGIYHTLVSLAYVAVSVLVMSRVDRAG